MGQVINRHILRTSVAAAALVAFATPVAAIAQTQAYTFDLPAQDLTSTLRAVASITRQQVTFQDASVRGKRAPALRGQYTVREALQRLVANNGLSIGTGRSGIFIIRPATAALQQVGDAAEGAPGQVAPGTNSGTTPADEEPTRDELDPNADDSETILVTGSRIPRPQYEGNFPGSQVTAEYIEDRNFTHLFDVLTDIPIMGSSNGANPYGPGGAIVTSLGVSFGNLLNLGTQRTLTLVNGRRFVSGNSATNFGPGATPGNQVDLSVIPVGMISRVDIHSVGGAAQYGSDAVGGVINVILKDDFEGITISGNSGVSHEGDLPSYKVSILAGTNFANGRGNITAGAEYTYWNTVLGQSRRESRAHYLGTVPNVFNGTRRNPNFVPSLNIDPLNLNNGAFLRASDDGQTATFYINRGLSAGSVFISDGGTIFVPTNAQVVNRDFQGAQVNPATPIPQTNNRPVPFGVVGNTTIIPYTPVAPAMAVCSSDLSTFCRFAPTALPQGVNAAQVIARFAPGFSTAGATQAQLNTLAVNLLQANLPTIGEYFSNNPNIDVNLIAALTAAQSTAPGFAGTSVIPSVENTDPATRTLFSRVARPLRFDDNGNLVPFTLARPQPNEFSGSYNQAVGGDFLRNDDQILLRVQQEKKIGTLFAHYDVTDNITVYTENLYADIVSLSPRRLDLPNNVTTASTELTGLIMNYNNPFLDAGDKAVLRSVGICPATLANPGNPSCSGRGNFLLSRTNVDVSLGTPAFNTGETFRTLFGIKGDFGVFGRSWSFDVAGGYARADQLAHGVQIRDIEFGLAIDAVDEGLAKGGPANGVIRCRSQVLGQVGLPPGVQAREFARELNADGVYVERLVDRAVTPEMIAACVPLNPFGYNQMSQAARDYVRYQTATSNLGEQYIAEASFSGSLFDLPGGPLGVAAVAEWRRESFDFQVDDLSRIGGARLLAFANTSGTVNTIEIGGEARIPIFGDGFNIPLFRDLAISPAIRLYKATGSAPDILRLNGDLDEQRYDSDWNTIWSLNGSWRPVEDLTFRASYTRSIRAPSVVELFLGGQPAIANGVMDICGTANIDAGAAAATRRANCEAAVVAAGIASNTAGAKQFLLSYNPPGQTIYGATSGSLTIEPEKGTSWGVGAVFKPRFLPGLTLSADYLSAKITDQITQYGLNTAINGCYDSPSFPDTTGEVGLNWCDQFVRSPANSATPFQLTNGYQQGYRNLGAIDTQVLIMNGNYNLRLNNILGGSRDLGNLNLSGQAQHLFSYRQSFTNDFNGVQDVTQFNFDGTTGQPKWEVQLSANYKLGSFNAGWTTNWQSGARIVAAGGVVLTPENVPESFDIYKTPSFAIHNANFGWNLGGQGQQFGINFAISNVFDKRYTLTESTAFAGGGAGLVSQIGRTYSVSANVKF